MLRKLGYAAFGLGLMALGAFAAQLPLPGGGTGPQLGDPVTNLFTLVQAYVGDAGHANTAGLSVSQTATQAACTPLTPGVAFVQIATSAATGSVCLPTAFSGQRLVIYNQTGQTIDIFGSNTFFTPGTQDKINNVTGSTAYAGLTTLKTSICSAVANGIWSCVSGS